LRRLAKVAVPSYPMTTVTRCVGLVSTALIGQYLNDPAALAAVGLSNVICNITGYSALWGLTSGISTLSSQDWGAGNHHALGITLQRAYAILAIFIDVPLILIWLSSSHLLVAVGQHPDVARYVGIYTSIRCVGLPFMTMNCVVSRTLQAISNVQINLVMSILMAVLNVVLSFVLIPTLGYVGAPLTATICDTLESIGIVVLAVNNADFRKCWPGFSRGAFRYWRDFLRVSCPSFVLMCIEWWTWDLQSFIAGFISELAQAIQSVAPAVGDIQYGVGQSMGNAAATVVGNMLGEGDHVAAKRAAKLTVMVNSAVMMVQLVIFIILRSHLARLFTRDPEILEGIVALLPYSLVFSFIDGNQASMCGILQGAGKQDIGANIVFVCYWLVGVPLGCLLAFGTFGTALGLKGQWIGMLVAVFGHAVLFLVTILRLDWVTIAQDVRKRSEEEASRTVSLITVSDDAAVSALQS